MKFRQKSLRLLPLCCQLSLVSIWAMMVPCNLVKHRQRRTERCLQTFCLVGNRQSRNLMPLFVLRPRHHHRTWSSQNMYRLQLQNMPGHRLAYGCDLSTGRRYLQMKAPVQFGQMSRNRSGTKLWESLSQEKLKLYSLRASLRILGLFHLCP